MSVDVILSYFLIFWVIFGSETKKFERFCGCWKNTILVAIVSILWLDYLCYIKQYQRYIHRYTSYDTNKWNHVHGCVVSDGFGCCFCLKLSIVFACFWWYIKNSRILPKICVSPIWKIHIHCILEFDILGEARHIWVVLGSPLTFEKKYIFVGYLGIFLKSYWFFSTKMSILPNLTWFFLWFDGWSQNNS